MNRERPIFRRLTPALLLCAAIPLAGCMTSSMLEPYAQEEVDPNSPAAAAIAEQAARQADYPTFADIPQIPLDLRSNEQWAAAVAGTEADRAQLLAAVAPSTWSLSGTQAFAQRTRAALGFDPADIPTADTSAASAAWARQMRARATPPPRRR
ncbi:MAG TPA: hypothetical protein VF138_06450 [Caulobacteraceae bacterium]